VTPDPTSDDLFIIHDYDVLMLLSLSKSGEIAKTAANNQEKLDFLCTDDAYYRLAVKLNTSVRSYFYSQFIFYARWLGSFIKMFCIRDYKRYWDYTQGTLHTTNKSEQGMLCVMTD